MQSIKEQILSFADWSVDRKGKAIVLLKDEKVVLALSALPDEVLKAALDSLLSQGMCRVLSL